MERVQFISGELERKYEKLLELLEIIPEQELCRKPFEGPNFIRIYSCGELTSRIGGSLEHTFNGITGNLWKEPFERIPREALPTRARLAVCLSRTARPRRVAFCQLTDTYLPKLFNYLDTSPTTTGQILPATLKQASHPRGQNCDYVHLLSVARLPSRIEPGSRS